MNYAISTKEGKRYLDQLESNGINMFSTQGSFASFWTKEHGVVTVRLNEEPYAGNPEITRALVSNDVNALSMLPLVIWKAWKEENEEGDN